MLQHTNYNNPTRQYGTNSGVLSNMGGVIRTYGAPVLRRTDIQIFIIVTFTSIIYNYGTYVRRIYHNKIMTHK